MSGLRSLLRLDDKVAAEGRRLAHLGGPSMRWLAPLTLVAAVAIHAAILLLPAVTTKATLPPASAAPAFPLVWRPMPPPPPSPESVPPPKAHPTGKPPATSGVSEIIEPPVVPPPPVRAARAMAFDPVPEPDPDLPPSRISAEVEAIIPNPDAPPPALDAGPSLAPSAGVVDTAPPLLKQTTPAYPAAAKTLKAEGSVTLRLDVLPDGTVGAASVEECSRPGLGFEAAALTAVRQWRYQPSPQQVGVRKVSVRVHFRSQESDR